MSIGLRADFSGFTTHTVHKFGGFS